LTWALTFASFFAMTYACPASLARLAYDTPKRAL